MERSDLNPEQKRALRQLERAIASCSDAGLAVVADFEAGFRIMNRQDLRADDLRKHGFTIDSHGNCGCPVLPRTDRSGNG